MLLPVLLFAVAGTSFASWLCRYDGVARSFSCCNSDKAERESAAERAAQGPVVGDRGCCTIERHEIERAPSDIARGSVSLADSAFASIPVAVLPPLGPPGMPARPFAEQPEPSPGGRAIVVSKHAFLI